MIDYRIKSFNGKEFSMNTPDFSKENIKPLFDSKFVRVFDLQYA